MRINDACIACGECPPYCPVGAIHEAMPAFGIDEDQCVDCMVCLNSAGCPVDAFFMPPESELWPRSLRREYSDPGKPHPSTKGIGRGTEEMKCNDVTGRIKPGQVGLAMEFGRPGIATRLGELEKMTMALAAVGVTFESKNPVYALMADTPSGRFKPEVCNERVLSAILEIKVSADKLPLVLATIRETAKKVDTVFSLDVISRVTDGGQIPVLPVIAQSGFKARPNAKVNLGLGRPLIP